MLGECNTCPGHTLRDDGKCNTNDFLTIGLHTLTIEVRDDGSNRNGGTASLHTIKSLTVEIQERHKHASAQNQMPAWAVEFQQVMQGPIPNKTNRAALVLYTTD